MKLRLCLDAGEPAWRVDERGGHRDARKPGRCDGASRCSATTAAGESGARWHDQTIRRRRCRRAASIVALDAVPGVRTGAVVRSRSGARLLGPALRRPGDVVPHGELGSRGHVAASVVAALLGRCAEVYRPLDPGTVRAAAAAFGNLELVLKLRRPGGPPFSSHGRTTLDHAGAPCGPVQLALACLPARSVIAAPCNCGSLGR